MKQRRNKVLRNIKKKKDKNGWHHVEISAEVAFFQLPQEAMRVRMAVFLLDYKSKQTKINFKDFSIKK